MGSERERERGWMKEEEEERQQVVVGCLADSHGWLLAPNSLRRCIFGNSGVLLWQSVPQIPLTHSHVEPGWSGLTLFQLCQSPVFTFVACEPSSTCNSNGLMCDCVSVRAI